MELKPNERGALLDTPKLLEYTLGRSFKVWLMKQRALRSLTYPADRLEEHMHSEDKWQELKEIGQDDQDQRLVRLVD